MSRVTRDKYTYYKQQGTGAAAQRGSGVVQFWPVNVHTRKREPTRHAVFGVEVAGVKYVFDGNDSTEGPQSLDAPGWEGAQRPLLARRAVYQRGRFVAGGIQWNPDPRESPDGDCMAVAAAFAAIYRYAPGSSRQRLDKCIEIGTAVPGTRSLCEAAYELERVATQVAGAGAASRDEFDEVEDLPEPQRKRRFK